jgi:RND superfamily putative drug exporter
VLRLARLSIRHPRPALAAWAVLALFLTLVGMGVAGSLSPSITVVEGTDSSRAEHLAEAEFGPSVLVPILLEGPKDEVDKQGPALAKRLADRDDIRVLTAWDGGDTAKELRPAPDQAMIVASVAKTEEQMIDGGQEQIEDLVTSTISGPVTPYITGQPSIDIAIREQAIDSTRTSILLALPLIFLVLLVVLRAPIAALALTILGGVTAISSFGLIAIMGQFISVDAITLAMGSTTALALGVGYGLMFYRRWREQVEDEHETPAEAALDAVDTGGRGILIGGTALITALIVASLIAPTEILTSLGIGVLLSAVLAVGGGVVVFPVVAALMGERMQWLSFPAPGFLVAAWHKLTGGGASVVRHPVPAGAAATALLVVLALPLLNLETGPPSTDMLPEDDSARTAFEQVSDAMGPGWPTPYNLVVASEGAPITTEKTLKQLDALQTDIAKDTQVASVIGPGAIAATSGDLAVLPRKLRESTDLLKGGKKDLGRLEEGLGLAGEGAEQLKSGLGDAASGAGQLQGGSGEAQSGAGQLEDYLAKAQDGSEKVSKGLDQALAASKQLRDGSAQLLAGSEQIAGGLGQAVTPVKEGTPVVRKMADDVAASAQAVATASTATQETASSLDRASSSLQSLSGVKDDPNYQAAVSAVAAAQASNNNASSSLSAASAQLQSSAGVADAFAGQVATLSSGLQQLYAGSTELEKGIGQLKDGNNQLVAGIGKLSGGGEELSAGLAELRDGAGQLENGLGQLTGGAGELQSGLSGGEGPTGELVSGLGQLEAGVSTFRKDLPSPEDLEKLQRESPGLFNSGYFVLAALSGATAADRNQATFAVNLEKGGNAGQIVVVSKDAASDPATQELGERLADTADEFAETTGLQVAVGGPAGNLSDFTSETSSRIMPAVIGVAIAVALLLMALLRAILIPLAAVVWNLLTVAATFGVLTILYSGDDPLLGGPGYIDPMSIIGIFAGVFGISIVYQVALLERARERFVETGDPDDALREGLSHTAYAATGAALAMVAAAVPFAFSSLSSVRQFGIGLAVVVVLDALIVRPVLLPASAELLGRLGWWPTGRNLPKPEKAPPARKEPREEPPTVGAAPA